MRRKLAQYLLARSELEGGLFIDPQHCNQLKKIFESLEDFERRISGCQKCHLAKTRNEFVFGVGNPRAGIVFVGEAPGAEEDRLGEPFVGRAGKLLDEILQNHRLSRKEVYICNILKCRPPGNRDPQPPEIEACEPYLIRQLEIIKPRIIVALGKIAAQTLLKNDTPIGKMRGHRFLYQGTPLFATYHPAALLRNSNLREGVEEDLRMILEFFNKM